MSLRKEYLREWQLWYNALAKARRDELEIYSDWLNFEQWFNELGPRPNPTDQFCRDDWTKGWTPDNAGWRSMPAGRSREYRRGYTTRKSVTGA